MGIATRVLASAGRSPDAVPAWRSAAAAFPDDEELQEGLFQSAARSLEYAALQTAAVRLMKLKTSSAEASAGERLSASWAAATATALASAHAREDSEVGPLGKAGLSRLARAMVGKLEREKKGGAALTSQQLSLVRALTREGAGRGDAEKAAWSSSSSSSSPAAAAAASDLGGGEEIDNDAVSIPDAFSDLKGDLSRACREALRASRGKQLDAVSAASRAFFARRGATPGAAAAAARVVSRAILRSRSRSRSFSSPPSADADDSAAAAVSVARAAVAGAREAAKGAKTAAAAVSAEDFSAALLGFGDGSGDDDEETASQYRQSLLSIVPLDALTPSERSGEGEGAQQVDVEAAIGAALLAVEAHVLAGRRKKKTPPLFFALFSSGQRQRPLCRCLFDSRGLLLPGSPGPSGEARGRVRRRAAGRRRDREGPRRGAGPEARPGGHPRLAPAPPVAPGRRGRSRGGGPVREDRGAAFRGEGGGRRGPEGRADESERRGRRRGRPAGRRLAASLLRQLWCRSLAGGVRVDPLQVSREAGCRGQRRDGEGGGGGGRGWWRRSRWRLLLFLFACRRSVCGRRGGGGRGPRRPRLSRRPSRSFAFFLCLCLRLRLRPRRLHRRLQPAPALAPSAARGRPPRRSPLVGRRRRG